MTYSNAIFLYLYVLRIYYVFTLPGIDKSPRSVRRRIMQPRHITLPSGTQLDWCSVKGWSIIQVT